VLNSESSKLNIIVTLIADIILLLTVLVGLFRLRRNYGGRFGLEHLLWNQVGPWRFPCLALSTDMLSIRKGVIWLLIGTVAELTPVVSLADFIPHFIYAHGSITFQLFISLYLSGNFVSPSLSMKSANIDLLGTCFISDAVNIVCSCITSLWGDTASHFSHSFCWIDVPDASATHDVNCLDTDVSLFVRLHLLH